MIFKPAKKTGSRRTRRPGPGRPTAVRARQRQDELLHGALDLFLEEDLDYARRLARQGVPVELHVYPGAYHAFDLDPNAQVAQNARRDSVAALRRFLHGAKK